MYVLISAESFAAGCISQESRSIRIRLFLSIALSPYRLALHIHKNAGRECVGLSRAPVTISNVLGKDFRNSNDACVAACSSSSICDQVSYYKVNDIQVKH